MLQPKQLFKYIARPMLCEQGNCDFASLFGSNPHVCALTWNLLDLSDVAALPKHLLWGLMLLKSYTKESMLCSIAGVSRATFRKWAWIVIKAIAGLSTNVVSDLIHCCGVVIIINNY